MKQILAVSTIAVAMTTIIASTLAAEPKRGMSHNSTMEHDAHCGMPASEGVINALDVKKSKVNITHEPIESIGWPEMKMGFVASKPVDLTAFSAGERVHFMLKAEKDKSYSIAMMCSLDAGEGTRKACMAKMHDMAMRTAASDGAACTMEGASDMKRMNHDDGADNGENANQDHKGHH